MSTQLVYSTKIDLLTEDRAQAFVDDVVKICGHNVYTFMDKNKDGTWTVEINYDDHCSNTSASRIAEELDELLVQIGLENSKRAVKVHKEIHGEVSKYWVGPGAWLEEAKALARSLKDTLRNLTDEEAKEVLEILVNSESE